MVRPPSVDSNGMKKGAWSEEEDNKLRAYVLRYGHWNWRLLPKFAGLARCGKSCRLRWVNYLKPGLKKGDFSKEEEDLIIKLHAQLGNKWSAIAAKLHGRTDNEIKNFYHTRIEKQRKRNPSAKRVKEHSSSTEESSQDQVLEGEKAFQFTQTRDEFAFSESTSLVQSTQSPEDLWPDLFQIDANYNQVDSFPPLMEEEFFNPELHYSELSSSDSSYMSALDWIGDDDHSNISSEYVAPSIQGSFWSESSSSNYQSESQTGYYDPLFQCFDYGMDLFS